MVRNFKVKCFIMELMMKTSGLYTTPEIASAIRGIDEDF